MGFPGPACSGPHLSSLSRLDPSYPELPPPWPSFYSQVLPHLQTFAHTVPFFLTHYLLALCRCQLTHHFPVKPSLTTPHRARPSLPPRHWTIQIGRQILLFIFFYFANKANTRKTNRSTNKGDTAQFLVLTIQDNSLVVISNSSPPSFLLQISSRHNS